MRRQILRLLIALTLGIGLIGPGLQFARAQNSGGIAIGDTVSIGEDGLVTASFSDPAQYRQRNGLRLDVVSCVEGASA